MCKTLITTLMLTGCFSVTAQAASFDCAKASTATEKLICGNEAISKLDEQLALSYKQALQKVLDKDSLKKEQMEWLKTRNLCKEENCLTETYLKRIGDLSYKVVSIEVAGHTTKPVFGITKGKEIEVCRVFNDYLNSSYYKQGDCTVGNYPPEKRWQTVEYKPVNVSKYREQLINRNVEDGLRAPTSDTRPLSEREKDERLYASRDIDQGSIHAWKIDVDLDNDGKKDFLFVSRQIPKDKFESQGCPGLGVNSIVPIENEIFFDKWPYMKQLLSGDPFIFDNKTFIVKRDYSDVRFYIVEPRYVPEEKNTFFEKNICGFDAVK